MHKIFVKTTNVKKFIGIMNKLIDKSNEVPKLGLIYGEPGLGKTQTAVWWSAKNDAVYIRAQNKMTNKWLLEKIVYELGEAPSRKISTLFEQCISHLRLKPQVIIIDEVDYLTNQLNIFCNMINTHDFYTTDFVFRKSNVKNIQKYFEEKVLTPIADKLGVNKLYPSDLVHNFVNLCILQGIPLSYIQKSLGCYGIRNIVSIYQDLIENSEKGRYNPLKILE